jgi:hypothetical protein
VLDALNRRGVQFMLVGLSAAVLQGADTAIRDIDMWFEDVSERARPFSCPSLAPAIRPLSPRAGGSGSQLDELNEHDAG